MKNLIKKTSITSLLLLLFMAINFETKAQEAKLTAYDKSRPSITVEELKANPEKYFAQYFDDITNGNGYKITGFNITVAKKLGESLPGIWVSGNVLNEKSLELISTILKGDKIIIDRIKGEKDGIVKNLKPIVINVE